MAKQVRQGDGSNEGSVGPKETSNQAELGNASIDSTRVLAELIDSTAVEKFLVEQGYRDEGQVDFYLPVTTKAFRHPETGVVALLTDSLTNPHDPRSQGGIQVFPYSNELVLGILVPCPSPETMLTDLSNNLELSENQFRQKLLFASTNGQLEACQHELLHVEQVLRKTKWGQVLATATTRQLQDYYLRAHNLSVPTAQGLLNCLLEKIPSEDERRAAVLISEIGPHYMCDTGTKERKEVAERLLIALFTANRNTEFVKGLLSVWNEYYSTASYYPRVSDQALDIAADWIVNAEEIM